MLKTLLILIALLGMISFTFITMTATPNDKTQYKAYERYKARVAKCAYKDGRTEEEMMLSNCIGEVEGAWKDERRHIQRRCDSVS